MKAGQQLGPWTLIERIGSGGNGEVWRASDAHQVVAVKILRRSRHHDRFERFRREVAFLKRLQAGTLPMVDSHLADDRREPSWYAMPCAVPIRTALGADPEPSRVLEAMAAIGSTLARLASQGVGHRDIKPDNLFELDGEWLVGDFGLVTYPERDPLTQQGRRLGPIDYMAPEMRHNADTANAEKADVYSLGKTLWVLLTGTPTPVPGAHRLDDPSCALAERLLHERTAELDLLIERCTYNNPDRRLTMAQLSAELEAFSREPLPESKLSPVRAELTDRIAALTAPARKRNEALSEFYVLRNETFRRFQEQTIQPFYHELARAMPGFNGPYGPTHIGAFDDEPAENLILHPGDGANHQYWGGGLMSPEELDCMVAITVGQRVYENRDVDFGVKLAVGRLPANPQQLIREPTIIVADKRRVRLGSILVDQAIQELGKNLHDRFDQTLQEVATRLADKRAPEH